ncbi:MAG: dTDP-4-dehydrorhamnose 3,5-epimerase [Micropepsaceae bacterium]
MIDIEALAIADVKIVRPRRFGDARGFFSETYSAQAFGEAGITDVFVQDNHSFSAAVGTVRGLHFQRPPRAQAKLVRVTRGRIWDVAVDLRRPSPSYGRWVAAEISAEAWNQIYIPAGFAHGFCTLQPDTEIAYKVTDYYAPAEDGGVYWGDEDLAIDWPVAPDAATLSAKDGALPRLRELPPLFE